MLKLDNNQSDFLVIEPQNYIETVIKHMIKHFHDAPHVLESLQMDDFEIDVK